MLGIDKGISCLCIVKNYLFMLAGIVYCVQVLSLKTLLLARGCNRQTKANCNNFIDMRKKYLADSSFSLLNYYQNN
jgi:hypothetical protein